MALRNVRGNRRWGAMAIETALVMIPTVMFLFGVFEYGRLLMDWNVLNNAAREGCRFALANNTDATLAADVQTNAPRQKTLRFLVNVMGEHRVMFGTDYPFPLGEQQMGSLVRGASSLTAREKALIMSENAAAFFNRPFDKRT